MRRSHVVGVKRIYVFSSIVISKRLLAFLAVASLLNLGLIYMILLSKFSSPAISIEPIFVLIVGLYRILMLNYAATIAREVKSGEIQLYLAHTLRRLEYVAHCINFNRSTTTNYSADTIPRVSRSHRARSLIERRNY
jgi:hypothetical protein